MAQILLHRLTGIFTVSEILWPVRH